jgi:uncharacterized protein YbcV (DUF1398 family)
MNTDAIQEVMRETQAGKITFPQVVGKLQGVGVESYFCDFATMTETIYMEDGGMHSERMSLAAGKIAEDDSASGIVAAIRGAQADAIRYPEFVRQSPEAGVIGYWAFLTGKKVVYFGRKGEMHVEEFPKV